MLCDEYVKKKSVKSNSLSIGSSNKKNVALTLK